MFDYSFDGAIFQVHWRLWRIEHRLFDITRSPGFQERYLRLVLCELVCTEKVVKNYNPNTFPIKA